ncbi:uncharacterized protein A4U43_C04F33640 [Asparagus officinalis]|uniref:Condensin complex subunit 1 C-terminal domain-containing protein n=1 Tax=Asparagus officinalis TaxID=4686 RepID=A0A5P1F638_ASPOF|nr:uncharacterized protein A4U43_C04F33640 [Asparagus officinalis]
MASSIGNNLICYWQQGFGTRHCGSLSDHWHLLGHLTELLNSKTLVRSGTPSAVVVAAGDLRNLAGVQELRQSFLEENVVPVLIRGLKSGTVIAQENSMGCLCNLAAGIDDDYSIKLAIFKEGVLDCMMDYMEELDSSNPCTSIEAARAITELNSKSRKEIVNAIPKLVRMVEAKGSEEKEAAVEALASICLICVEYYRYV